MPTPPVVPHLEYSAEVHEALNRGKPVVALESTIISHGMPFPQNITTAREVEQIVRDAGAVPATIAVLSGQMKVGLEPADLDMLATSRDVQKVSVRDLPVTLALGLHGATTVAATMRIASLAGIRVFATGGIGGVHRGGAVSMDVSADLTELCRTSVAVVSAGVKSILDIGLTLEMLETLGVPVIGYRTSYFPAFYSRATGHAVPARVDSVRELALVLCAKWSIGLEGGVLVANPVPEADEIPASEIEPIIDVALRDMERDGIGGRDATPFLLRRIVELTEGRSLGANIALVRSNARLAAEVAVALADMYQSGGRTGT
ncbi:MAG: pseudouridine-5'-phosphate glycosidase [Gemmatimonadota bacterium]|nr:pseudouridine-5'-phosphate glycosidase [Gemmatimonadota bacterium]